MHRIVTRAASPMAAIASAFIAVCLAAPPSSAQVGGSSVASAAASTTRSAPGTSLPRESAQQPPGRVVVLSLDGLAHHFWQDDPAAGELDALRRVAEQGVVADGAVSAFPSVTPAGHASLWTGTYGRRSGIVAAGNPMLPRAAHTVFQRHSGYDAEPLRAEPLWVTAARAGLRVVAHQSTQNYPFTARVTASAADSPPVLVNGYGPGKRAPHALVDRSEMVTTDPEIWGDSLPGSSLAPKTLRWRVGPVTYHGALVADGDSAEGYTSMHVAVEPTGASVRVHAVPVESEPPHDRQLARHFSDGLLLGLPGDGPLSVAYFRLYQLSPDGSRLTLYQPSLHELAVHDGSSGGPDSRELLSAAGGFIGNGPSMLYRDGDLGTQLYAGGDGRAERRYLEGVELVLRQYNRLSRAFAAEHSPDLLLDYSNYPDEVDHLWYGLVHSDAAELDRGQRRAYGEYRRWAYAALNRRIALLDSIAGPSGHLIVSSDHGMTAIEKNVRVNVALRNAGLLHLTVHGSIDPLRTEAVLLKYCVMVNTEDWKNGIVLSERREQVVDSVAATLRAITDPETGERVFTEFFRPEAFGDSLGIGGPNGCDLYFDMRPGFAATGKLIGDVVVSAARVLQPFGPHPYGYHGFLPTRRDMLSILVARGPSFPAGRSLPTVRTIDVAPTVSEILGIRPPRASRGRSLLDRMRPD